jgi:predicted alpha/beta superfamily hydrolase
MNHDIVADGAARLHQSPLLRVLAATTVSMHFFFVALWLCERISLLLLLLLWLCAARTASATITNTPCVKPMLDSYPAFTSRFVAARTVNIYLPACYRANPTQRCAVLYMHDGQNLFDPATSFIGVDWAVHTALEQLLAAHAARPTIIVGIWNTPQRLPEYLPAKPCALITNPTLRTEFLRKYGTPLSDAYLRFIVSELKPFIDARYRTLPDRANTFIMGSSMGGLISLYAVCEYPAVFGSAGCLSTHWPAGDGIMIEYLRGALPDPAAHKLYFDHGTATLDASYEAFQHQVDAVLRAAGYTEGTNWLTRRFPGHEHSERAWRRRVHIPLQFLLAP